jgi:hypothetical protein
MSSRPASPARPKRRTGVALVEYTQQDGPLKVDRGRQVIPDVKLIGTTSRNGRRYPRDVLRKAVPMFEGAACYVNHPVGHDGRLNSRLPRRVDERFGHVRNVRAGDDGLYGDLHYLAAHKDAALILEAAERGERDFGMSLNGDGDGPVAADGIKDIAEIWEVRSVDVVTRPGTTSSFFEQDTPAMSNPRRITVKSLLEAWAPRRKDYDPARLKAALLELGAYGDTPVGEDDAPPPMPDEMPAEELATADPDEQLWTGFWAAITAIGDQYKAGELDARAAGKAVARYFKSHEGLVEVPEAAAAPEADESDDSEGTAVKEQFARENAALKAENAALKAEKACRELCESHGFAPEPAQLKALVAVDEATRKELVESFGGRPPRKVRSGFATAPPPPVAPEKGKGKKAEPPPRDKAALVEWFQKN